MFEFELTVTIINTIYVIAPFPTTTGHIDGPITGSCDIVESENVSSVDSCAGAVDLGRLIGENLGMYCTWGHIWERIWKM